jgi:hypothetical protein
MTNKEISKYINRLNLKKGSETIFCREISDNVIIAKVWPKQPKLSDSINGNFSSYNFFFIRNDFGKYIGAVLDMYSDLHWFISPKFRKQGFLTNAMKQSILPYIFYNREKQQITISRGI